MIRDKTILKSATRLLLILFWVPLAAASAALPGKNQEIKEIIENKKFSELKIVYSFTEEWPRIGRGAPSRAPYQYTLTIAKNSWGRLKGNYTRKSWWSGKEVLQSKRLNITADLFDPLANAALRLEQEDKNRDLGCVGDYRDHEKNIDIEISKSGIALLRTSMRSCGSCRFSREGAGTSYGCGRESSNNKSLESFSLEIEKLLSLSGIEKETAFSKRE